MFFISLQIKMSKFKVLALALAARKRHRENITREHRFWEHDIIKKRKEHGTYHHLVQELEDDDEQFQKYFRVNKEQFTKILNKISPLIEKSNRARETIGPKERLCICLR